MCQPLFRKAEMISSFEAGLASEQGFSNPSEFLAIFLASLRLQMRGSGDGWSAGYKEIVGHGAKDE